MAQNSNSRGLETVTHGKQTASASPSGVQAWSHQVEGSGAPQTAGQLPLWRVDLAAPPAAVAKPKGVVGKRKPGTRIDDEALSQGVGHDQMLLTQGGEAEPVSSSDSNLRAMGDVANSAHGSTGSLGDGRSVIELAQLELPAIPAGPAASSAAGSSAASAASAGVASSWGGVGGLFGAAAGLGLAAGGGGGGSSAGSITPVKIASPTSTAPAPTVAASDVISLFSDKYTNVPVTDWNPYWSQSGALSDANAIGGDHIKRIVNLNYQGVQIANSAATSGLLDVSAKKSLHMDFWLPETGAFTLRLISKDGVAAAKEAGVKLFGVAGWNSVDIGLDSFNGIDLDKIYQMVFVSGGADGTSTSLHFDNVYFSSTAGTYSAGLAGRLVNGYIKNALVFQDNDGDGQLDNNKDAVDDPGEEPYTYTGADGQFNLVGARSNGGPLITQSDATTVDVSTGLPVSNVFKAPAGAKVISPLSTLLEAGTRSGLTEAQLKNALGISPSTSLLQLDPVAAALSGTDAAAALQLKAANVMVSNLMDVGSSLIQGSKTGATGDFSSAVVSSLVSAIKANPTGVNLGSSTVVSDILTQAASTSSASAAADLVTAAANQLSSANTQIKTAAQSGAANPEAALRDMAKLEKVVQSTVAETVKDVAKGSASVAALNQVNVQTQAAAAEVPPVLQFKTLGFEADEKVTVSAFNGASHEAKTIAGNTVIEFTKAAGDDAGAAGVNLATGKAGSLGTIMPLGLSPSTETKLGMWVNSAREGTRVTLEIGDSLKGGWPNDGNFVATEAVTTKAGWEYLTFDFAKPVTRYVANGNPGQAVPMATALKPGITYDMINLFFDLGDTKLTGQKYQFDGLGYAKADPGPAPSGAAMTAAPAIPHGYSLAFSDDFGGAYSSSAGGSKTAPDAGKWEMQTGRGPNNDGWGNGEAQTYTNSLNNAYVQGGALHIVANKTGSDITSARLKSVFDVLPNGYVEVRAALPAAGPGAWPAIWLLGQGTWPATGEIDIMEWTSQYFKPNQVQAALHFQGAGNPAGDKNAWTYGDTQKKDAVTLSSSVANFHTYQVWWTQDYIRFGVDANNNDAYYQYTKPANATSANWPFTNPMDLILNMAVGGSLGGAVPAGDFSYEMLVDSVKVYQSTITQLSSVTSFESGDVTGYGLGGSTDFGGAVSSLVSDGPAGSNGKVAKVVKGQGAETWAGTTFLTLTDKEVISAGNETVTMKVYSPEVGATVMLKVEQKNGAFIEKEVKTTKAGEWETLSFSYAGANHAADYKMASVFFDFGKGGTGKTFYFDDVSFGGATPSLVPVALAQLSGVTSFESGDATGYGLGGSTDFGGAVSSLVSNGPAGSNGKVAKVVKGQGAETWAGTTFLTLTDKEVISAGNETVTMKVYSPEVGATVMLKVEQKNGAFIEKEVKTTKAGEWETLSFSYAGANHAADYKMASVFFDFGKGGTGKTFYFDDVSFGGATPSLVPVALAQLSGVTSFESGDATGYGLGGSTDFGGAVSSLVSNGPAGSNGKVAKVVKGQGAETWAGTTFLTLTDKEVISAGNETVTMKVYSPEVGATVMLKVEQKNGAFIEKEVKTTKAGEWETLSFSYAGANHAADYKMASVFFDFGKGGTGKTFYFDDVSFGGATPSLVPVARKIDFDPSDIDYLLGGSNDFGRALSSLATDPVTSGNSVAKVVKTQGAESWAGTTFAKIPGYDIISPTSESVEVKVWAPSSGLPVRMKLETIGKPDQSVETEVKTSAVGWQDLTFNFANPATGTAALSHAKVFDMASIFFDFGSVGSNTTFYFDDVSFRVLPV